MPHTLRPSVLKSKPAILTGEFPARGRDTLYVSLPAWSPGNYEIQNYARYVRHFAAATPNGQPLFWDRADKDTWRVATAQSDRVGVEFDYLADTIDLSMGRITGDFGQFLGTNLFLYEEGRLDRPAEVRFALPAGWQVTTSLHGSGVGPYTAPDYHELADAFTARGADVSTHQFPCDGPLPPVDSADHIVMLGAIQSVYDDEHASWIEQELAWLRAAPVLVRRPSPAARPSPCGVRVR